MKRIILSFDDSRADFYTNVFPLLKKHHLKATLNVISDFIVQPDNYSFPSGDNKAMTVSQVKECFDSGIVEIACHGHTHLNTQQDIQNNIEAMAKWGIAPQGIGMASSGSNLTWKNKNDNGLWDLVQNGTLLYVRSGLQIRREGLIYAGLCLLDRYIHSKRLFAMLNKRTLVFPNNPQTKSKFFLSTAIHSHTKLHQIKYFIESAPDDAAIILMFHSVLKKGERGYGADRFYYDYDDFDSLLNKLAHQNGIEVCTTKEFVNEIMK